MAKTLNEQAQEILKVAEESGVQSNFFFVTTFKRYLQQIKSLDKLEEAMKKEPAVIEKEYVKGRANVYVHPLISEYNKTTDSANKTVACLMKIIRTYNVDDGDGEGKGEEQDPLLKIINGSDDDDE